MMGSARAPGWSALFPRASALRPRCGFPVHAASVALALGVVTVLGTGTASAQQVRTAVQPDTVTVGEVARIAMRIDLPPGWWVVLPDSLELGEDMESAGPRTLRADTLQDRSRSLTVAYPVKAWRPGTTAPPTLRLHAGGPQGEREVAVDFPALQVRSVLPAEISDPEPRPLKDVLGPNRVLWPLLAAGALAAFLLGAWLWRRSRRRPASPSLAAPAPVPPREAALAALDRARAAGMIETGRMKAFYSAVAEALRVYLDALDPRWGAELTTSELRDRLRGAVDLELVDELVRLLTTADMVKFARRHALPEAAQADWTSARSWVERFEPALAAARDGASAVEPVGAAAGPAATQGAA